MPGCVVEAVVGPVGSALEAAAGGANCLASGGRDGVVTPFLVIAESGTEGCGR